MRKDTREYGKIFFLVAFSYFYVFNASRNCTARKMCIFEVFPGTEAEMFANLREMEYFSDREINLSRNEMLAKLFCLYLFE